LAAARTAVAWRRLLAFLRAGPEGSGAVEGLFDALDGNGDRTLDVRELADGLRALGVPLLVEELDAFVADMDVNHNGIFLK